VLLEWSGQRRCAQRWGELVRPDDHARLALPTGRLEAWLERDRATEPHARPRDKLDRYEELALALGQPLTLLFVAPASGASATSSDGLRPTDGVRVLTTTVERHDADPLAANWLIAGVERRVALADLATPSAAAGRPKGLVGRSRRSRQPTSGRATSVRSVAHPGSGEPSRPAPERPVLS
jgi:hypothetical protein